MMVRFALIIALAILVFGCSRTQQRVESVTRHQETNWANRTESVEEKKQQNATETKRIVKRTTRSIVRKPDGTVSDTTVVEDSSTDQTARSDSAATALHSKQAMGADKKASQKDVSVKNESQPARSTGVPWKLWLVIFVFLLVFFVTLLWRKGTLNALISRVR